MHFIALTRDYIGPAMSLELQLSGLHNYFSSGIFM